MWGEIWHLSNQKRLRKTNYHTPYFSYLALTLVPLHTALTYHRTWETGLGRGYEGLLLPALIFWWLVVSGQKTPSQVSTRIPNFQAAEFSSILTFQAADRDTSFAIVGAHRIYTID